MLASIPPMMQPVQRETKPSQPPGTKNAQNRVPCLGLTTCLVLKLGLSSLDFWSPLFYISLLPSSKRCWKRASIQRAQGKLGTQRQVSHPASPVKHSPWFGDRPGNGVCWFPGMDAVVATLAWKGAPPSVGEAFALELIGGAGQGALHAAFRCRNITLKAQEHALTLSVGLGTFSSSALRSLSRQPRDSLGDEG